MVAVRNAARHVASYSAAGSNFRDAQTPADKRRAMHMWLVEAVREAMDRGEDVAPALALLAALEGLEFGKADPILKAPAGRSRGAKAEPPASISVNVLGLAAVQVMFSRAGRGHLKRIAAEVEDALNMKAGSLKKLRENFSTECGKPAAKRTIYLGWEQDVEKEVARYSTMTDGEIVADLRRVVGLLGL